MKKFVYARYQEYINAQLGHQGSKSRTKSKSYLRYIDAFKKSYPDAKKILCVGARDSSEVIAFRNEGYDAIGIDLYTDNEEIIKVVDMHNLSDTFKENEFDVIFSCHSLEHAYDPEHVLKSFRSIATQGCFLILPTSSTPDAKDPVVFDFMITIRDDTQIANQVSKTSCIVDEFSALIGNSCNMIFYSFELYPNSKLHEHWIGLKW